MFLNTFVAVCVTKTDGACFAVQITYTSFAASWAEINPHPSDPIERIDWELPGELIRPKKIGDLDHVKISMGEAPFLIDLVRYLPLWLTSDWNAVRRSEIQEWRLLEEAGVFWEILSIYQKRMGKFPVVLNCLGFVSGNQNLREGSCHRKKTGRIIKFSSTSIKQIWRQDLKIINGIDRVLSFNNSRPAFCSLP